uniref:Tachykinin-4 n=1 Tax=Spermophilus dauricus TaxID=99837 RepID=A0A8C9PSB3_SPEDA
MLPCLTLLLLIGPSVCNTTGDSGEELALSAEAGPWVTLILEEVAVPSIQLQLQEGKRSKANQFFGLMGKQVEGYKLGQMVQALLRRRGSSMEGKRKPLVGHRDIIGKWPCILLPIRQNRLPQATSSSPLGEGRGVGR